MLESQNIENKHLNPIRFKNISPFIRVSRKSERSQKVNPAIKHQLNRFSHNKIFAQQSYNVSNILGNFNTNIERQNAVQFERSSSCAQFISLNTNSRDKLTIQNKELIEQIELKDKCIENLSSELQIYKQKYQKMLESKIFQREHSRLRQSEWSSMEKSVYSVNSIKSKQRSQSLHKLKLKLQSLNFQKMISSSNSKKNSSCQRLLKSHGFR